MPRSEVRILRALRTSLVAERVLNAERVVDFTRGAGLDCTRERRVGRYVPCFLLSQLNLFLAV
jgi:hypothetical protein